jgi:branched-chain amino acid transport system permease protein
MDEDAKDGRIDEECPLEGRHRDRVGVAALRVPQRPARYRQAPTNARRARVSSLLLRAPAASFRRSALARLVSALLVVALAGWLTVNAVIAPSDFANNVLLGITIGAIYALIALGFTLIYSVLELIHLAHGEIVVVASMLTAFLASAVGLGDDASTPVVLALVPLIFVAVAAFGGVLTATIDILVYRRLRMGPPLAALVASVGIAFIVKNGALVWAESGLTTFRAVPAVLPEGRAFEVLGVTATWNKVVVALGTGALLAGLLWVLNRTAFGKAVRAAAQEPEAAALVGIDVNRTITHVFFLAGALAGSASALYAFYFRTINIDQGLYLTLIALTAAVLGGIGSITGTVLGALVIGLVQAFSDGLPWHAPGSAWTHTIVFSTLIAILVLRPTGLLGTRAYD